MNYFNHFSSSTIILMNNSQVICGFFQGLFSTNLIQYNQPFLYYTLKITSNNTLNTLNNNNNTSLSTNSTSTSSNNNNNSSSSSSSVSYLILIDSSSCDEKILNKLSLCSVRCIFLYVDNLQEIMLKAIGCGGQVTESKIDSEGNKSTCTIEGPEGIILYVSTIPKNGQPPNEWIVSTIASSRTEDEDEETRAKIATPRLNFHPRPIIHTLDVSLLSKSGFVPCPPNSRKPTPFETDIFKGHALIVVRTNPLDTHYRNFFLGKRMFEVQVQGSFKVVPTGLVYVGADAVNKMELGLLTRSFCRVILQFVMTMVRNLHYSFGESPDTEDYEISHIVAPLFSTMDKIVVTPQGQTPPPMGVPFPEDQEFRKLRLNPNTVGSIKIDPTNVYSFSVNTSNMDLCSWTLVNIPMLKDLSLNTFCGGFPIRLVGYEVPPETAPDKHSFKSIKYVFNLQLAAVDSDKQIDMASDEEDDDDENNDPLTAPSGEIQLNEGGEDESEDEADDGDDGVSDDDNIDTNDEGESEEKPRISLKGPRRFLRLPNNNANPLRNFSTDSNAAPGRIRNWFRREIGELFSTDGVIGDLENNSEPTCDRFMEVSSGDLKYCPACIEFADNRKDGRKKIMFIFCYAPELSINGRDTSPKLRAYHEFSKTFPICRYGKLIKTPRIAQLEKFRRQLVVSYRGLLSSTSSKSNITKLEEFLGSKNETDRYFLENSNPVCVSSRVKSNQRWEGSIALATDRRMWIEKSLIVTSTEISFLRHSDSRKSTGMTLSINSILSVRILTPEEIPFPGFGYFQIETFLKVFIIMVRSNIEAESWIRVFSGFLGPKIIELPDLTNHPLPNFMESSDLLFDRPNCYKLDRRRVYNFRRIIFHTNSIPIEYQSLTPNQLVENTLNKAFELVSCNPMSDNISTLWIEFMNSISLFQSIDLISLNERQKIALLLNLYHIMVLHGFLLLGPPVQSSWSSFYNTVSYVISHDVCTINELHQNGLRSAMCKPSSQLLNKKISIKSFSLGLLSLTQKDFRLNFCINCGSKSMPSAIPVYYPDLLDEQLDIMTSLLLAEFCQIDTERKNVELPRFCSWYLRDFSKRPNGSLPIDCLRVIMPYLKEPDRIALLSMLEEGISPNIQFRSFIFRSRTLTKLVI